ncbi:DUF5994 family protein [Amycolatopsis sp. cmx-4-61]|uniref:DUF5994 family protein n=1 Tax=Amycolatopsis sp. cmx-4-61 TaxID=2790937 RepID=UPI00397ABE31
MLSGSNTTSTTSTPFAPTASEPRLRLKPTGPTIGRVDGAWWPRTRDLSAELPSLLVAVAARLGRIDRVTYHLGEWPASPRRLSLDDGVVRLEGFRSQHPGTLTVIGWDRLRLTLLVVPPETGPDAAQRALTAAADRDSADDGSARTAALPA